MSGTEARKPVTALHVPFGPCAALILWIAVASAPAQMINFTVKNASTAKSVAGSQGVKERNTAEHKLVLEVTARSPSPVAEEVTVEVFFFEKPASGGSRQLSSAQTVLLPMDLWHTFEVHSEPVKSGVLTRERVRVGSNGDLDYKTIVIGKTGNKLVGWAARMMRGGKEYRVLSSSSDIGNLFQQRKSEFVAQSRQVIDLRGVIPVRQ